jgi:hypothetical protein
MRDLGTNDGTGTSKQDNGILNEMKALRCHKKSNYGGIVHSAPQ